MILTLKQLNLVIIAVDTFILFPLPVNTEDTLHHAAEFGWEVVAAGRFGGVPNYEREAGQGSVSDTEFDYWKYYAKINIWLKML